MKMSQTFAGTFPAFIPRKLLCKTNLQPTLYAVKNALLSNRFKSFFGFK